MKIHSLPLSRIRNNAHFQVHTDFIGYISKFGDVRAKIEPIFDNRYMPTYRKVDEALKKVLKSIKTEQIQDTDRARDEIWLGLLNAINAGLKHFNPEVRLASKQLKIVTDTYGGKNLAKLPFNEQTSALYNVLQDLTQKYSADVSRAGLTLWVEELQNLNSAFNALMKERYDEVLTRSDVVLKEARVELDKYYNAIIDCINAFIMLEGETIYADFVRIWNGVLAKYRKRKYSAGSSGTEAEEDSEDDEQDELEELGT